MLTDVDSHVNVCDESRVSPRPKAVGRFGGGKSGKSRQPKAEGRGRFGGGKKVIRCGIKTMPEWMVCFYNSRKET